jgi:hypothetical protein
MNGTFTDDIKARYYVFQNVLWEAQRQLCQYDSHMMKQRTIEYPTLVSVDTSL